MPFFSKSITTAWRVTKDTPEEIQYVQKQLYGKFGFEKEMISTVVMKLGQDGRIKHFEDRWGHNPQPGLWAWLPRRLNAVSLCFIFELWILAFTDSSSLSCFHS
jgi:hypothetical protein